MGTLIAPLTNPLPLSIRPLPFYPDWLVTSLSDEGISSNRRIERVHVHMDDFAQCRGLSLTQLASDGVDYQRR